MTKTKAQLRAEAVERLKEVKPEDSAYQILNAIVGEYLCDYIDYDAADDAQRVIDLLTDDEPVNVKNDDSLQDSREKLEEDVRQYANPEGNTGTLGACWERKMIEFIDSQAAITRAECEARTCTLAYDGKWLTCSNCGESLQWFGVRTVYKAGTQERALGVEGVKYCAFCGARIEGGESE